MKMAMDKIVAEMLETVQVVLQAGSTRNKWHKKYLCILGVYTCITLVFTIGCLDQKILDKKGELSKWNSLSFDRINIYWDIVSRSENDLMIVSRSDENNGAHIFMEFYRNGDGTTSFLSKKRDETIEFYMKKFKTLSKKWDNENIKSYIIFLQNDRNKGQTILAEKRNEYIAISFFALRKDYIKKMHEFKSFLERTKWGQETLFSLFEGSGSY